ncbi:MAG: sugar ABC transporter substrate-binding protein [Epulopiscium sp.]|nr:sugar ABC transporter substrate-binding protein [Candidatus Epulonipiscium sp.]
MKKVHLSLKILFNVILILSLVLNIFLILQKVELLKLDELQSKEDKLDVNAIEEYVWIATMTSHEMYVEHEQKALKQFGKEKGIKVTIEGPKQYDIPGQILAIEQAIKRKPAGIMVLGMEKSLIPAVNKAVEAGIPTITVDADLPESKRLAHVGSNWFDIGVKQGEAMAKLIGGKGKVAMLGIGGADNMQEGFKGFKSVLSNYSDIIVLGEFDDMSDVDEAYRITKELLTQHLDIAGIAGFDSNSGPGIGKAIKEMDMVGKVKVTSVDMQPQHVQLLKEGVIHKLIGQKRELFTYYGAQLLYDINHSNINITPQDEMNNITSIPEMIYTGLVEIDKNNVDKIFESTD